jgi:hypothetical protein
MAVTGDDAALRRVMQALRGIDRTLAKTPRDLAGKAAELTRLSANSQRTPDGDPWKRGPATSPQVGRKTGAMLGSIRGSGSGLTFTVRVGRRYAWYFQHGAIHREASGSKFRRSKSIGKKGARERLTFSGPVRKGRERGFQEARQIVPGSYIPRAWRAPLESIIDKRLRADLSL